MVPQLRTGRFCCWFCCFAVHMPLLMASSTFRLGRRCCSS